MHRLCCLPLLGVVVENREEGVCVGGDSLVIACLAAWRASWLIKRRSQLFVRKKPTLPSGGFLKSRTKSTAIRFSQALLFMDYGIKSTVMVAVELGGWETIGLRLCSASCSLSQSLMNVMMMVFSAQATGNKPLAPPQPLSMGRPNYHHHKENACQSSKLVTLFRALSSLHLHLHYPLIWDLCYDMALSSAWKDTMYR